MNGQIDRWIVIQTNIQITNKNFRSWLFCIIRTTYAYSHSPFLILHVMTSLSVSVLYRSVCFSIHALPFHPSIHRLCAAFWVDVSFDQPYPSSCIFPPILHICCVLLVWNFSFHFTHAPTLYTSAYSDSTSPPDPFSQLRFIQTTLKPTVCLKVVETQKFSTSTAIWHDPEYHHLPLMQTICDNFQFVSL